MTLGEAEACFQQERVAGTKHDVADLFLLDSFTRTMHGDDDRVIATAKLAITHGFAHQRRGF